MSDCTGSSIFIPGNWNVLFWVWGVSGRLVLGQVNKRARDLRVDGSSTTSLSLFPRCPGRGTMSAHVRSVVKIVSYHIVSRNSQISPGPVRPRRW